MSHPSNAKGDQKNNSSLQSGSGGTDSKEISFLGTPGPFQIIDSDGKAEAPTAAPRRRYSCRHYDGCLNLAAALNWDNFTCRGCSGTVNQSLLWRAHQAMRRDDIADRLCEIPDISCIEEEPNVVNISSNRKVVA